MALPTTVFSEAGVKGHHPPFKSSGGAYYALARTTTTTLDAYKATDPTDSWSVQDGTSNPDNGTFQSISAVQSGDVIHIATVTSVLGTPRYFYHTFNMADDTWGVVEEEIENPADAPDQFWISIAVRSDGDVIVAYNGSIDKDMGDNKERVDYARREASSWTVGIALDAGGDVHYGNPNCVLGTNDGIHFLWGRQTGTANDPPTQWRDHQGRTLNSSNALSNTATNTSALNIDFLLSYQNMVSYDDGGTQRMAMSGVFRDADHDIVSLRAQEDGLGNLSNILTGTEGIEQDLYANGEVGILSVQELGADLHALYSGGGTAGVDQDLYYTKSTDDGVFWDAPTEELDAVTVNYISANIYSRGSQQVTGWTSPGTVVGNRGTGDDAWINPNNAKLDDGNNASYSSAAAETSQGLAASNFGFSLPANALVTGVEIRVGDHRDAELNSTWDTLRLIRSDNTDGFMERSGELSTPTATNQTDDVGGNGDLWGEPITKATVEDVDFGFFVKVSVSAATLAMAVDFLHMRIHYAVPPIVMAYLYDDGGTQKYNEKVLIAGAAPVNPALLAKTKTGVRYY